jgi:hypothetical protein
VSASISTPGAVDGVDVRLDLDERVVDVEVDQHRAHEQRVAQRDQVGGALGGLDAGHPGHVEHVALAHRAPGHQGGGLGLHVHPTPGHGPAVRRVLGGDVDHAGPAQRVEVGEALRHGAKCRRRTTVRPWSRPWRAGPIS